MSPSAPHLLGGRYELQEVIGRGGMAEVWRARDMRLGRDVAVKQLRIDLATDPTFQARFEREAQSAAGLNHPNIVSVYDTGGELDPTTGVNIPYIVMELVGGRTLRDMLREGRTLAPDLALMYTQGVLDALNYSHKHGIIHRDIKPANVMITPTGQVKVMDFGIARAVADTSATMTQTAAVIGTAQYLSPEQARGETVDSRSDIYSGGCLLYELLTGRPPFVGDSPVAVAYQHVREQAIPPSQLNGDVTPEMDAVTMKALAKNPADRYQDALAMREDISRLLGGQQITAQIPAVVPASPENSATRMLPTETSPQRALPEAAVEPYEDPSQEPEADEPQEKKRRRRMTMPTVILLAILVILLTIIGVVGYRLNRAAQEEARTTTVPAVIGFTQDQAVSTLKNYNLDPQVQHTNGDSDTRGTVVSTDPSDGTTVQINSAVTVVVNDGPAEGTIPDVTGKSEEAARAELQDAGFTSITVRDASESQESTSDSAGNIVVTDPSAGTSTDPDTTVTLYRATGRSRLPDISSQGYTEDEAKSALAQAGFTHYEVVSVSTNDYPAGTVIGQVPQAGQLYARTETVTIRVASAIPTVTTTSTPTPSQTPSSSSSSASASSGRTTGTAATASRTS